MNTDVWGCIKLSNLACSVQFPCLVFVLPKFGPYHFVAGETRWEAENSPYERKMQDWRIGHQTKRMENAGQENWEQNYSGGKCGTNVCRPAYFCSCIFSHPTLFHSVQHFLQRIFYTKLPSATQIAECWLHTLYTYNCHTHIFVLISWITLVLALFS